MSNVTFTDKEMALVSEILHSYFTDLRMEIARTDNKHVRDELKEKELSLKGILERLPQA